MDTETPDGDHIKELVKIEFTMSLTRSKTDRIVAGVCGGWGRHFDIKPWMFRILFLLVGGGFWIYIIMWAFIKEDNF